MTGPSRITTLFTSLLALSSANPLLPNTQFPLTSPSNAEPLPLKDGVATLEVQGWSIFGSPAYITPIAVGTPIQVFRAYIDLDFSGLLVRDISCGADSNFNCGYGGEQGFVYNGSASSTYQDADESFDFMLPATFFYGNVSLDDVKLVDRSLENVTLGSVTDFHGENYFLLILSDIADGHVFLRSPLPSGIGLAPPNKTASVPYSKHPTQSILSHILSDSSLAKPLLSFSLPRYGTSLGSIKLGGLPSGHEEIDLSIPFGDLGEGWNVPLASLILGPSDKDDKPTNIDMTGLKLYPALTAPGLMLPHNLTKILYSHLHALPNDKWQGVKEFNCSYRGYLPDISLSFPDTSTSITFSEEDYTIHGYMGEDEVCLLTITDYWGPPGSEDAVAIGTMLWERWHVVFDLEDEFMGLISREENNGERMIGERTQGELEGLRKQGICDNFCDEKV